MTLMCEHWTPAQVQRALDAYEWIVRDTAARYGMAFKSGPDMRPAEQHIEYVFDAVVAAGGTADVLDPYNFGLVVFQYAERLGKDLFNKVEPDLPNSATGRAVAATGTAGLFVCEDELHVSFIPFRRNWIAPAAYTAGLPTRP